MAIPIDLDAQDLFYPQNEPLELVYDEAGKPAIEPVQTGPPNTFDEWRDPYALKPPGDVLPVEGRAPTTNSPSPSFLAPRASYDMQVAKYEPPPRKEKPFKPLSIAEYSYNAPDIAKYQALRDMKRMEMARDEQKIEQRQPRSVPEPEPSNEMLFDPMYGWLQNGAQRPPMVVPHAAQSMDMLRRRVMPGRWR